ncbi:MAG: RHS repeat-associated core domain-containing protein, partial [Vicingaceae bacterium]
MPGRHANSPDFRYGFIGKEKDLDLNNEGNTLDFGARIYDGRIGKFLSIDPWTDKYAWQTPYAYFKNSPIYTIDWNGFGGPPKPKKPGKEGETKTTVGSGESADDFSTTSQEWVYHEGSSSKIAESKAAGWVTVEEYSSLIRDAGSRKGAFSQSDEAASETLVEPTFMTYGRSFENEKRWASVYGAAYSEGVNRYHALRTGRIASTTLELDVLLGAYSFLTRTVYRGAAALAQKALKNGKTSGAASVFKVNGKTIKGVSGDEGATADAINNIMLTMPKKYREPWTGFCSECVVLDKALLKFGTTESVKGGVMETVNIGSKYGIHTAPKAPCKT